jgi:MYXO-CTERM domain-containing protein
MKRTYIPQVVGAGLLVTSLAVVPLTLPAQAQTNANPDNTTSGQTARNREGDRHSNWGWLGLIGLAGLAGLARRKSSEPTYYRDPAEPSGTSDR